MALLPSNARLLLRAHRGRPFEGDVLQLGRTLVFFTDRELDRLAELEGVELQPGPGELSHDPALAAQGCISDRTFFTRLGLGEVASCDVSSYEGADFVVDLNEPLPGELCNRFDLVFDAGTIQHVFHVPRFLANVHEALREGGRAVFSATPTHNMVDHGFYTLSPTLLSDYYRANRYGLEAHWLYEIRAYWVRGRMYSRPARVWRYTPGCLDHLSFGGLGRRQLAAFCCVRKQPDSTVDAIPMQSYLERYWPGRAEELARPPEGHPPAPGLLLRSVRRLVDTLRRFLRPRMPPREPGV